MSQGDKSEFIEMMNDNHPEQLDQQTSEEFMRDYPCDYLGGEQ